MEMPHSGKLSSLDAQKSRCVIGSTAGTLRFLDLEESELKSFAQTRFKSPISSVVLLSDETTAIVGFQNGELAVVRADTDGIQVIFKVDAHNGNTVTTVAIANSEALVATGGKNKSVRLWKFNGDQLDELLTIRDFPLELESLQFNDDASRLGILLHAASAMQVLDLARLRATFDKLSINW